MQRFHLFWDKNGIDNLNRILDNEGYYNFNRPFLPILDNKGIDNLNKTQNSKYCHKGDKILSKEFKTETTRNILKVKTKTSRKHLFFCLESTRGKQV